MGEIWVTKGASLEYSFSERVDNTNLNGLSCSLSLFQTLSLSLSLSGSQCNLSFALVVPATEW